MSQFYENKMFRLTAAADARARLEVARNIVRETIQLLDPLSSGAANAAAQSAAKLRDAINHIDNAVLLETM